jgi:hypothetical protein
MTTIEGALERLADAPYVEFEIFGFVSLMWIIADLVNETEKLAETYRAQIRLSESMADMYGVTRGTS